MDLLKKYIIKGEPNILPIEFFRSKKQVLEDFLRNNRNIKVRFVLVCIMEKKEGNYKLELKVQDKAYFHSNTYINFDSTDEKEIVSKSIKEIIEKINIF